MACILTAGRELPCKEYSGGVKEVLFIGSNQFYDFKGALTIDGTNDNITAIAGSADTFQAFRYDLKPGAGNTFIETIEANEDGGIAYSQELNISLNGFSNTWRKELILLARNRRLLIAVRDSNENLWLMGYDFKGALTIDGTNDNITAIAGSADTFQAFRYDLKPGAGNTFIETIEANEEGGIAYSQELNISLNGFSNTWRKELILLARNRRLLIAVRDSNENLWLMGYDNGAEVTGGSHDRGAVLSDFTGSKLTFTAMTTKPAYAFAAFTTNPFDNFAAVEVSPSY